MLSKRYLISVFFITVSVFAVLGAFARVVTSFNHNEHMYITAGVLIFQKKALYQDFAYLQMPYLPLIYSGVYKIFGLTTSYFLIGKLISFFFLMVSALILFLFTKRVSQNINFSLGITVLFLLNTSIIIPASEVSNYVLPIAFSFVAIYFSEISFHPNKLKPFLMALSGLFLGLAVGTKLTYASIILPFVLTFFIILFMSRSQKSLLKEWLLGIILPWSLGIFSGLLPALIFYLRDPEVFVFNNWGYHFLNSQWRFLTGYTDAMSWPSKLVFAGEIFLRTDNLILLVGSILGGIMLFRNSRTIKRFPVGVVLALLLLITALLAALAPTPSFFQYYALPVSFLFILLMYLWAPTINRKSSLQIILLIMVLFTVMSNAASLVESVKKLSDRSKWSGVYVNEMSVKIREIIIENRLNPNGKVATLSPLFALEAGLSIYNELATGPFLYRVGDLLAPHQRVHFVATSPETVHRLLENDPPVAILTGYEGDLDDPLIKYAEENTYKKVDIAGFEGILLIRSH